MIFSAERASNCALYRHIDIQELLTDKKQVREQLKFNILSDIKKARGGEAAARINN